MSKFDKNFCQPYSGKESFEEWFAKFQLVLELDGTIHPNDANGNLVNRNSTEFRKFEAKRTATLKCMLKHQAWDVITTMP